MRKGGGASEVAATLVKSSAVRWRPGDLLPSRERVSVEPDPRGACCMTQPEALTTGSMGRLDAARHARSSGLGFSEQNGTVFACSAERPPAAARPHAPCCCSMLHALRHAPCSMLRPWALCRLYSLRCGQQPTIARSPFRFVRAARGRPSCEPRRRRHAGAAPARKTVPYHWAIPFVILFPLRPPSVSNRSMDSPYSFHRPAGNGTTAWASICLLDERPPIGPLRAGRP